MTPEGNPRAERAGTTGRSQKSKKALTTRFWQPLPWRHLLPAIWCFDVPLSRLGVGGGVEPMRESPSSGPSEPRAGLDCQLLPLSLLLPLPHLRRRRLCVCACVHLDTCSISLSLLHLPFDVSFLSLVSLCVSPRVSLQKNAKTCAKLTAP
jgi:hypothetical protein